VAAVELPLDLTAAPDAASGATPTTALKAALQDPRSGPPPEEKLQRPDRAEEPLPARPAEPIRPALPPRVAEPPPVEPRPMELARAPAAPPVAPPGPAEAPKTAAPKAE